MKTIKDVKEMAIELMNTKFTFITHYSTHTISANDLGYYFEFGNKKKAFGTCYYVKKKIQLSLPLCSANLDKIENIRNTMLHEIAHALCVYVYGTKHGRGHGAYWKSIAKQIGCNGERCFSSANVSMPKSKYSVICDSCGYSAPKYRKVTKTYACANCCNNHNNGKFSYDYKLRLVENY
jgi:predicted SprT family Zn-dependent metalloprotease